MSNGTQTLQTRLERDLGFYVQTRATSSGKLILSRRVADIGAEGTTSVSVTIAHSENEAEVIDFEGFYCIAGSATFRGIQDERQAGRVLAYLESVLN